MELALMDDHDFGRGVRGRQAQRQISGFARAENHSLGPLGENAFRIGAYVVLAGIETGKFETTVCVRVRGVGMQAVGGLDRHAGILDWLAVLIHHSSRDCSQTMSELSGGGGSKNHQQRAQREK